MQEVVQCSERVPVIGRPLKELQEIGEPIAAGGEQQPEHVARHVAAGSPRLPLEGGFLLRSNPDLELLSFRRHGRNLVRETSVVNTYVLTSRSGRVRPTV